MIKRKIKGATTMQKKQDLELIDMHEMNIVSISNGSKDDNGLRYQLKSNIIHINSH